ncbi:MAG: alpha/beta fold hydrolase, partial [Burkholderiaceae bacterium]
MDHPPAFYREAGAGQGAGAGSGPGAHPAVVCLHSNASSSAQWRDLMALLAPTRHVLAPDSYGAGKSPEWPSDRTIALADEAALIEPVLARAGTPLVLVGHSYGAALALVVALARPQRLAALVLYEPTLFGLIDAQSAPPNDADGIRGAVAAAARALDAGDRDAAAGHFIDYWMGPGSWAATPEARRPAIAASVVNVRRWAHALLREPT